MGSQSQPNHGLLIGAIVYLLKLIEMDAQEANEAESFAIANKLWKVGTYICILMVTSLCGHEGFYLDLAGLHKDINKGRTGIIPTAINKHTVLSEEVCRNLPHVTICLLGKFKGKTGTDHHLITVANETSSGLRPHWWLERLVEVCELEGKVDGPAFASADGTLASSTDYGAMFRKYLGIVQEETDLIPGNHDVNALYSTFCTPRTTATMRIEQAGFGNQFVDQMNRWRLQEKAQG
jgi:hypothetical protein